MNISWSLHELIKEADWIAEVGSSDREVDKVTTNKLFIVYGFTLYGEGVGIQFEVSVERGSNGLTVFHPKLEKQIEIIMSLRDHDVACGSNYFNA